MTGDGASRGYPDGAAARDAWILTRRPERNRVAVDAPYAAFIELEPLPGGGTEEVLAIFLSNRECPVRCLMCDLWKNTLPGPVPPGAVAKQVADTLARFPRTPAVKLYNAGSFFDPQAFPAADRGEIARLVAGHRRVVVESHPSFLGGPEREFARLLGGRLEVAVGLETTDPEAFARLNKRTTLAATDRAFRGLAADGIDSRAFVLVGLPGVAPERAVDEAVRSARWAFDRGVGTVALIPTRSGNGAMEALEEDGTFVEPALSDLERAADGALAIGRGIVLADTWDLPRFARCPRCADGRIARVAAQNLAQQRLPPVACDGCVEPFPG